jgi:hypothetical protein
VSRYRAYLHDPTGTRHGGLPTWPWHSGPAHLLTRRQLAARGLRPGRQPVAGQILWRSRHRVRAAYLYDTRLARPKKPATPRQLRALDKAMTARRLCPTCGIDVGYCIPRSLGQCVECHDHPSHSGADERAWAALDVEHDTSPTAGLDASRHAAARGDEWEAA